MAQILVKLHWSKDPCLLWNNDSKSTIDKFRKSLKIHSLSQPEFCPSFVFLEHFHETQIFNNGNSLPIDEKGTSNKTASEASLRVSQGGKGNDNASQERAGTFCISSGPPPAGCSTLPAHPSTPVGSRLLPSQPPHPWGALRKDAVTC